MNDKIEKLKSSLVYKMSLGSKELYHTNIWAWLIEQDWRFVKAFVPRIPNEYSFECVNREEGNRDLTLWFRLPDKSRKCYVIENKLKSIPSLEQLMKYTEGLKDSLIEGILTGLKTPNIVNDEHEVVIEGKVWRFLSYSTISEKIRDLLASTNNPVIQANRDVIKEYLDNNDYMEQIVNENLPFDKLLQTKNSDLDNLGLEDLINKLAGSSFVHFIKTRLEEDNISIPLLNIVEGFHRKQTTIDFRLSNRQDDVDKRYSFLYIGIQIEANQYRRMVDRRSGFCTADEIFEEFSEKGFFDANYEKNEKLIRFPNDGGVTRPTKQIYKYNQYFETCIYQYSILEEDELGFEDLYQRIKKDLVLSSKLMAENNKEPYKEHK